jgi:predicted hotdog family 3-hydroxylacyl-ACP dehydratase
MSAAGGELFRLAAPESSAIAGEGRWRVEIPTASPLFAGHFPGHPILPGIAHLAMVERALGRALAGVRSLKLRRPVGPGDALALWISSVNDEGWARFELRRGEEAVSSGAVACRSDPQAQASSGARCEVSGSFPAVEALLPHAPPARLVREVVAASSEEITCVAEIPVAHSLAAGEHGPAFLGIEAAAQAAAALEALERRTSASGPRIGYLVGIREARFAAPRLPAGRPLRVMARRQGSAPPLSIYEIAVDDGEREAVTGTISTFLAGPIRGE